jgi:tetratricopeptide (TPR) repeat protein/transglutaminase-like putative cysteine protease
MRSISNLRPPARPPSTPPQKGARQANAPTSPAPHGRPGRLARLSLGAWIVAASLVAPADPTSAATVDPAVARLSERIRLSKGAEAVIPLRDLWGLWDTSDPDQVEAALVAAAAEAPAEVRPTAEFLRALARRRRGDTEGAARVAGELGTFDRFLVLGPFDDENRSGFGRDHGPEGERDATSLLTRSYPGAERSVRWRKVPTPAHLGIVDGADLLRPQRQVCAYLLTWVRAKKGSADKRDVSLFVGAEGAFKLFWNGEEVLRDEAYRALDLDRRAVTVTLAPGHNTLLAKVCGGDEAPRFTVRAADLTGRPDRSLELVTDPELAGRQLAPRATKPTRRTKNAKGLFDVLSAQALSPSAKPSDLETFAAYLQRTGGDARPRHDARDLAALVAGKEPTVPRLLLAASLAPDRNQRREWLDKAAPLVGLDPRAPHEPGLEVGALADRIEVLLAYAALEFSGPDYRAATPLYHRILRLDPDEPRAVRGLASLHQEAGLPRTALALVERALERRPSTPALLRTRAAVLRALGRDQEADEADARYAAYRFDDETFVSEMVGLARARRDSEGAERWLGRASSLAGGAPSGDLLAARTLRGLGQPQRALAAYQRALVAIPDDVDVLREVAELHGDVGDRDKQLGVLRQVLALRPQAKDVRDYLEQADPPKPRPDEAWAWKPEQFLSLRAGAPAGLARRTLRNLTTTTIFESGISSKFRQVVFQPLTDEAAASAREFAFSYQADRQVVTLRGAKVYRADGRVDEAFETGESAVNDPSIAMYTSTRIFYVHFPRIEAGDVVEVRYRLDDVSAKNEVADHFGEVELVQDDVPIESSEYVLIHPTSKPVFVSTSYKGLARETKVEGDRTIERFTASAVPAVSREPSMPPLTEAVGHVHVSTFGSWRDVGTWYWGLAKDQVDLDDETRSKARALAAGKKDDRAKVAAVFAYVTQLRYVALEFGIEGIRPRRCSLTVARGWGDCKDKATVLVAMLRELGIDAHLVLVRTQMRGDFESEPASLAVFDHAIAYVPSLNLYLDGTAEGSGTTELPEMDRGAMALLVDPANPRLVRLPNPGANESATTRKLELALASDGSAQVSWETASTGAHAPSLRAHYRSESGRGAQAGKELTADLGPVDVLDRAVETNDLTNVELSPRVKAKGKAKAAARKDGASLSLPAGPALRLASQFASLAARTQPVVLGAPATREDEWVLQAPAGHKVTRLPMAHDVRSAFGSFSVKVEQAGGKVTVKTKLLLDQARVGAADYSAWRSFAEEVERWSGQRVVFSK